VKARAKENKGRSILEIITRLIFAFFLITTHVGCNNDEDNPHTTAEPENRASRVVIESPSGTRVSFKVEVARTPGERERGLMFRQSLPENHGMLFIMPREEVQYFWMKNTLIPLDIIFIDSNMRIVGIIENTEPLSTKTLTIGKPSKYVLEINAGLAKKYLLSEGSRITFENVEVK